MAHGARKEASRTSSGELLAAPGAGAQYSLMKIHASISVVATTASDTINITDGTSTLFSLAAGDRGNFEFDFTSRYLDGGKPCGDNKEIDVAVPSGCTAIVNVIASLRASSG
jgi:hypothetical protein